MPAEKGDKKDKPEKPAGFKLDPIEALILGLLVLGLLGSILPRLLDINFWTSITFYGFGFDGLGAFFTRHSWVVRGVGFGIAAIAGVASVVFNKAAEAIELSEKAKLFPILPQGFQTTGISEPVLPLHNETNSRWKKIVELSETEIESNWRLAIIEADIMLDSLLDTLRLPGDTMGDKLKAVEKSDFTTLDYAWEAHKARNMIAHQGSDFMLNQRETRRIISLYEAVFKEFLII